MQINKIISPSDIVERFWQAPNESLWSQKELSIILGLSQKWFEQRRWVGDGIEYFKLGRSRIRYQKSAVLGWLAKYQHIQSTSQDNQGLNHATQP